MKKLLIIVAVGLWVLLGCSGPIAAPAGGAPAAGVEAQATALPFEVLPAVVAELHAKGEITVIDVREDWEYAEGHIAGAQLIPLGTLPDRIDEIPKEGPVVMVCRSGNRSGQAFQFLRQQGFDNVHNMVGGMNAWKAAGLEIEK